MKEREIFHRHHRYIPRYISLSLAHADIDS